MPLSTLFCVAVGTPARSSAWPTRIFRSVSALSCAVAAVARDDHVRTCIARGPHQYWLQDAVAPDRFRKFVHLGLVEELARVLPRPDAPQARCFLHVTSDPRTPLLPA